MKALLDMYMLVLFLASVLPATLTEASFCTGRPPCKKIHNPGSRPSPLVLSSIPTPLDTVTSGFASILRYPAGTTAVVDAKKQEPSSMKLTLHDLEQDPDCRRVRERISELDLVVQIVPATGERHSKEKMTIPRLDVAGDQSKSVSGAESILSFLNDSFQNQSSGTEETAIDSILRATDGLRGWVASYVLRPGRGSTIAQCAKKQIDMKSPLILYSYEGNQFCRLVREVLTELNLTYEVRSAAKGSPRRKELAELTGGKTQCPYLVDPNTDTSLFESADIVAYLYRTYARWTPPNESLQFLSENVLPALRPLFRVLVPLQAGSSNLEDGEYRRRIVAAKKEIQTTVSENQVVIYTFQFSPYSIEAKSVLENLGVKNVVEKQIGLTPLLMNEEQAVMRAALFDLTGRTSLPSIFIDSESIGGLFDGTPGLIPMLDMGEFPSLALSTKSVNLS